MKTLASQASSLSGPVKAALGEAVKTIAQRIPARAIYLFGSYARGEQRPESDIDLLVVVDDETEQPPDFPTPRWRVVPKLVSLQESCKPK